MLVHDETPRTAWKLAIAESLIKGGDRLVRAEKNSYKHCLYKPTYHKTLCTEICAQEEIPETDEETDETVPAKIRFRPLRAKAMKAVQKIADWARKLRAALEDVK